MTHAGGLLLAHLVEQFIGCRRIEGGDQNGRFAERWVHKRSGAGVLPAVVRVIRDLSVSRREACPTHAASPIQPRSTFAAASGSSLTSCRNSSRRLGPLLESFLRITRMGS